MRIYTTKKNLQSALKALPDNAKLGFVPTMGALHKGHLSLIKAAKNQTDYVVVSIFVNPTQFDNQEDLTNYPSTLETDLSLLEEMACDFVFIPSVEEMYNDKVQSESFDFENLETVMEGAHRKGHFDGVGTIVKQLFEIVKPDIAFFGEKDFQQLQIIKKMVEKEVLDIEIQGVPIYREPDGLAMSSRNARLLSTYRKEAPFIYKTLKKAKQFFGTKDAVEVTEWVTEEFKKNRLLQLEYFTIADEKSLQPIQKKERTQKYRAFIAVFAGDIRLIDNIALY